MKFSGVPVVDAPRSIKITILAKDVKAGDNKNPDDCAAAVAVCRQVEGAVAAKVHIARTYIKVKNKQTGKSKWLRFGTPHSVRGEIIGFDRGGTFEPGEYHFSPVQPSCRFGAKRNQRRYDHSKGPRHGKPSKRSKPHFVSNIRGHAPQS